MKFIQWPLEMFLYGNGFILNKKCVDKYTKVRSQIGSQEWIDFKNYRSCIVKIYALYLRRNHDNDSKNSATSETNVVV